MNNAIWLREIRGEEVERRAQRARVWRSPDGATSRADLGLHYEVNQPSR